MSAPLITVSKDGGAPLHIPPSMALAFWRAFRAEIWRAGICRDPQPGDEVLGVRLLSVTL